MADATANPNAWVDIVDHYLPATTNHKQAMLDNVRYMAKALHLEYDTRMHRGRKVPQIRLQLLELQWTEKELARYGVERPPQG